LAPQHSVTFHAVFCHGSPYVDFVYGGTSRTCELADLLVVMDYLDPAGSTRQAALVQAKMVQNGQISICSFGPNTQLDLYQNWPPFKFQSAAYSQHQRDFPTALNPATDSGRYGGIDLTLGAEEWRQVDPLLGTPFIASVGTKLGAFLARLADGQLCVGAPATYVMGPPTKGMDDWSFTVAELLDVTGKHVALTRVGGAGTVRGKSHPISSPGQSGQAPVTAVTSRITFSTVVSSVPPEGSASWGRPPSNGISYIHGIIERAP
jgi:hypothetical protein